MPHGSGLKMNDFTKEELEDLAKCINELYKKATINPRISFKLKAKIKSMIDNYCEHDHEKIDTNICYRCGWGVYRNE